MSKKHSMPGWKRQLRAFCKSKNFVPAVICIVALLVALIAGIASIALSRRTENTPDDSSQAASGSMLSLDESFNKVDDKAMSGTVLPETPDAGQEYLDETLFIGDSNTQRYLYYSPEENEKVHFTTVENNIGVVSMGVTEIAKTKCEQFSGHSGEVTIPEAVKIMQPRRIIIGFGTNSMNMETEAFIESYQKSLKAIHDAYPYADMIVNAIPPLDKQRDNTNLSMKDVDRLNTAIVKMCEEEGYKYLDSSKALEDPETGWAKKDYTSSDGVHLSQKGVRAFFEYVRTHAYITEDTRPKPLKKIPKVVGVTPNIITNDPIAVRGSKVPVEFVAGEGGRIEGETSQKIKKGLQTSTVRAVANEGWEFDGWTATLGHVDQNAEIKFTVPGNADANGVVLTARFVKKAEATPEPTAAPEKVTVKFRVSAEGGGKIEGETDQKIVRGQKAQMVTAKPDEGWEFVRWDATSDTKENKVPQNQSLSFVVPEWFTSSEIVVTATFRQIQQETPVPPEETPEVTPAPPTEAPATPVPPTETPVPTAVPAHCDVCGQDGHTADTCPNKCPVCGKSTLDGHTHEAPPQEGSEGSQDGAAAGNA